MNWRRGLFRLWLVFSALFVIAITVVFFPSIRNEFEPTSFRPQWPGHLLLPANCTQARGKIGVDYEQFGQFCWYKMEQFREQFPEYNNLSDDDLSDRLYSKAGLSIREATAPWPLVSKVIAIAVGVPLIILVIGAALFWAFVGFTLKQKAR
jgi:hypothetical protein